MGFFLNSCSRSANSKTKFKSKSKLKSKSKDSDSSKALSKLMKSANAPQPKGNMFLVRHTHNEALDYSVISTEGSSFRVLHDDDDDLPCKLLSLLRFDDGGIFPIYYFLGCYGSWIWLLYQPSDSPHEYLVWDMETDSERHRFPCVSPREYDDLHIWASGIGFDPSSGHYKLVIVWVDDYWREVYAEVSSLGTGSWKAVHYPYDSIFSIMNHPDIYSSIHINGFNYWVSTGFRDGSAAIMSFDFAKDRFPDLIPLPKEEEELDILVEFQGSLAAICCDLEDEPLVYEIWAWNARAKFWSLVSTFDFPEDADPCAVLNLYNNDKSFVENFEGELLLYDHATRRQENLGLTVDGGYFLF